MTSPDIVVILAAYLVGGTPIGLMVGLKRGVDIREHGSGNIGASNVLRILGVKTGVAVWLADILKGWAPVYVIALTLAPGQLVLGLAGVASVVGHCFSPYLKLRGGRGVATGLGALLALDWRVGLCSFGVWVLIVLITRYISLASLVAASTAPGFFFAFGGARLYEAMAAGIALLVIGRHWPNIRRLLAGTETRIGERITTRREEAE